MGFRFRKSFGPRGLKVNITKNGISSVSIGRAPFTVNIPVNRSGGVRTTASIPGSGLSWSEQAPTNPQRRRAPLPSQGSPSHFGWFFIGNAATTRAIASHPWRNLLLVHPFCSVPWLTLVASRNARTAPTAW